MSKRCPYSFWAENGAREGKSVEIDYECEPNCEALLQVRIALATLWGIGINQVLIQANDPVEECPPDKVLINCFSATATFDFN